jgi:tetratricopeptide (TPR) repeat protein
LEAKYRLGEFYFGARRLEEAETVLREAVGLDADALRERLLLGRVLEARGLVQEAQDIFLTAVRRVPTTSEGYRLLSEFCNQRGYASAAEELLRKAIVMETTTPRSYLQLADMLASRGKMDEAIKCLEDADRRRPGDPGVLFKMGWLYEQSGNREKMKEAFVRFLDAENASERHHRFLACIALERWDQAFEEAEIILDGWDETQEYHRLFRPWADHWLKPRSNAYYEDFERRLRFVSERIPENPWPVLYRGSFLVQLKKRDEAVSVLNSLSGFDEKRYGWMRFAGGVHKLNCGRFDGAVKDLEAVVRSRPRAWWARCRLAEAHLCMGRTKEAFEQFDAAEAGVGNRNILANVWGWRGEAMLWLGMYEEALTELNRAMSGGSWLALCWRGAALMQLTRHEEAFADLDKAITSGSRDAEAFVWRGELNRRLGKMKESLEDLNRAVELNGGAWANVNRAMTLSAMGRRDEMVRDFKDVPAAILINALNEAGIDPRKELSDTEAVRGLETALRLAKGVRRYEDYLAPLWIKGIGPQEACEAVQLDSPHLAFPDKISSGFVWRIG